PVPPAGLIWAALRSGPSLFWLVTRAPQRAMKQSRRRVSAGIAFPAFAGVAMRILLVAMGVLMFDVNDPICARRRGLVQPVVLLSRSCASFDGTRASSCAARVLATWRSGQRGDVVEFAA